LRPDARNSEQLETSTRAQSTDIIMIMERTTTNATRDLYASRMQAKQGHPRTLDSFTKSNGNDEDTPNT
jgi:hypothetical protein